MIDIPRAFTSSILVALLLGLLLCGGLWIRSGWHCRCSAWSMVVREDATVSVLAMSFVVKDAWSIAVELACFAFVALTFKIIFAEQ
jgi:hypothetical protein